MKVLTIICAVAVMFIFFAIIVAIVQAAIYFSKHTTSTKLSEFHEHCVVDPATRHVITLSEHNPEVTLPMAKRFPYVAAVTRNSTTLWPFACFASVILFKWIVTSAHCRRPGSSHRVILYHDYVQNQTYAFPILYWRIHEKFNISSPTPKYDIAVAKLNLQSYHNELRPAVFNKSEAYEIEASVWKTVSTMDKKLYLTNVFTRYFMNIAHPEKCYEMFGVAIDESLICVDSSDYDDCVIHDYGPLYMGDKLVGLSSVKPPDCEMKLSIFTNISFYTDWILQTTHER